MKAELDCSLEGNINGYNLISVSEDVWAFEVIGTGSFMGSFREVVEFAVWSYALNIVEIEKAIEDMLSGNNDAAHFGAWGTFIFSFNKLQDVERKAS